MSVIQHAERNGQSPKGPPISQEYARSSVPGCMDLPNPTPKAWQPGPSFVSSPSVRRKHRVRRVAHAADRRAIHSPARTSQQVESSNAQKMAHSPHPPPARRVLHVHATTSPIEAGCIPDVAVSLLPHPPHVAQTRMPDRTRMPADSPACPCHSKRICRSKRHGPPHACCTLYTFCCACHVEFEPPVSHMRCVDCASASVRGSGEGWLSAP